MGFQSGSSFQLFPGVRLNISGSGISATFGVLSATAKVGPHGFHSTVGLPSSGLSYTHNHWTLRQKSRSSEGPAPLPDFDPSSPHYQQHGFPQTPIMRPINSASVEDLTSQSLLELRDLIAQARFQRDQVERQILEVRAAYSCDAADLIRREKSLFRFFYKQRIAELSESVTSLEAEIVVLEEWQGCTHVDISFHTTDVAKRAYGNLVRAFDALRGCNKVWDVTSDRDVHRVIERTAASRTLERTPVDIAFASSDLVRFDGRAMRFGNANGEDILIYPGVVLMPRADGAFALVELREVKLEFEALNFIERDQVPSDSRVVGETWAKVNKDGSRDLRFRDNYRIPIALYGTLLFTTPAGIQEEYQFSEPLAAAEFAKAFVGYQAALAAT